MASGIVLAAYCLVLALLLGNAIVSWLPRARWHPLGRLLLRLTEPMLQPIRRRLRPVRIGRALVDFSAVVLIVALQLALAVLLWVIGAAGP